MNPKQLFILTLPVIPKKNGHNPQ